MSRYRSVSVRLGPSMIPVPGYLFPGFQFSSVTSCVQLFVTPWIAARQAFLSITNSQSSPKLMSVESVMPSSHLILCRPLLLLPPIPPSIRVFSNESTLHMRWPKYWSFSFIINPSKEHPGLISFRMDSESPLSIREMQIKARVRSHYIPGKIAKLKDHIKYWWGYRRTRLSHTLLVRM